MKMYNAAVEVANKNVAGVDVDELMRALSSFHPAVGTSPRGWLEARISLPAENLTQACTTAAAVIEAATGAAAIACEVMTEDEFNARQGYDDVPDLLGAGDVAKLLGVTRQRVDQLAKDGRLQTVPVGKKSRAFVHSSVEAFAAKERHEGRPRKHT